MLLEEEGSGAFRCYVGIERFVNLCAWIAIACDELERMKVRFAGVESCFFLGSGSLDDLSIYLASVSSFCYAYGRFVSMVRMDTLRIPWSRCEDIDSI